jgi:hypothetical protein
MFPTERLLKALQSLSLDPETAAAERVAPLLYFGDPEGAAPALRKAYYESAARSLLLLDALDELTAAFASQGVRPVVLKGADFARRLYPSPAVRPMSDVDIWVSPDEAPRAESVLDSLGYRPVPEMTPGLSRAVRHARTYAGARPGIAIDLHWSLVGHETDRRAPSLDWFRTRVADGRLDTTASLLYLAAHVKIQHYDEPAPLIWLADFYLLSREPDADFPALFSAARSFGWELALAGLVDEVQTRLGVELPSSLAAHARPMPASVSDRKGGPEYAWNELRALPFRGRAALLRAWALPSPSYIRFRYCPQPAWTWPLFYPVRWARLLSSAATIAIGPRRSRPLFREAP